eukprot:1160073-Pelagomonas_calceolata.AAC.5
MSGEGCHGGAQKAEVVSAPGQPAAGGQASDKNMRPVHLDLISTSLPKQTATCITEGVAGHEGGHKKEKQMTTKEM